MKERISAVVLKWPKQVRPIPLDSMPGADIATQMVEMTKKAHQDELKRQRKRLQRAYNKERQKLKEQVAKAVHSVSTISEIASQLSQSADFKKNR